MIPRPMMPARLARLGWPMGRGDGWPVTGRAAARRIIARPSVRLGFFVATGVLLAFGALYASIVLPPALTIHPDVTIGMDVHQYLDRTRAWLAGDGFYLARQLAGPYTIETGDAMYPPPSVLLFAPFVLGAPIVLWWAIPLAAIAVALRRLRPPLWTWPVLAAILVYPRTWTVLVLGNPSMWAIAAGVAGMVWGWPAVGALLKPVFAPFALLGVRRRSWWVALGVVFAVALPFGAMWGDYAAALLNAQNPRGLEYTLGELPIGLVFLVAGWAGRRQAGDPGQRLAAKVA